jgi:N-acylneuraminate cytidylyltransferase/CMP-N,N'-diacetyllegionaminic acid synthase
LGLWDGRVRMHVMPRERSIDIDSEFDFLVVEQLMRSKNGKS